MTSKMMSHWPIIPITPRVQAAIGGAGFEIGEAGRDGSFVEAVSRLEDSESEPPSWRTSVGSMACNDSGQVALLCLEKQMKHTSLQILAFQATS